MMNVIKQNESIHDINYFLQAKDEVDSWFFITHNWPIASILTIYISFIYIDLKFFEKRKPIDPKLLMLIFNIYQVVTNAYIVYLALLPDSLDYLMNHSCHPADPAKNQLWFRGFYAAKLYMISKLADLLDTVFIVLRKKKSQVTFLHVYHHFGMVLFTWYCLKYHTGEQLVIVGILNPSVHVVMYSYYCLSLMGKSIQKYLWWKNYVTILQLFQLAVYMVYMVGLIAFGCKHSTQLSLFVFSQGFIFYALFTNFYNKQYCQKKISPNPGLYEKTKVT